MPGKEPVPEDFIKAAPRECRHDGFRQLLAGDLYTRLE